MVYDFFSNLKPVWRCPAPHRTSFTNRFHSPLCGLNRNSRNVVRFPRRHYVSQVEQQFAFIKYESINFFLLSSKNYRDQFVVFALLIDLIVEHEVIQPLLRTQICIKIIGVFLKWYYNRRYTFTEETDARLTRSRDYKYYHLQLWLQSANSWSTACPIVQ